MADITLRTETTGIRPSFEHVLRPQRRALRSPKDSGRVMHRQINERSLGRWLLSWDGSEADYEGQKVLVELAWADAYGGVLPMDYTPVGEVDANAVEVCFVEDTLIIRRDGPRTWSLSVEIEEAHA